MIDIVLSIRYWYVTYYVYSVQVASEVSKKKKDIHYLLAVKRDEGSLKRGSSVKG